MCHPLTLQLCRTHSITHSHTCMQRNSKYTNFYLIFPKKVHILLNKCSYNKLELFRAVSEKGKKPNWTLPISYLSRAYSSSFTYFKLFISDIKITKPKFTKLTLHSSREIIIPALALLDVFT